MTSESPWLRRGARVVCTDASEAESPCDGEFMPVVGCIYTVRWRDETRDQIGLEEIHNPPGPAFVERGYRAGRFRPAPDVKPAAKPMGPEVDMSKWPTNTTLYFKNSVTGEIIGGYTDWNGVTVV